MPGSPKGDPKMWALAGKYSAVGLEMAIAVTIGHFGGEYLDARFHTKPVFSYALLIAGVAAAFLALYRIARAGLKDEKSDGDAPR